MRPYRTYKRRSHGRLWSVLFPSSVHRYPTVVTKDGDGLRTSIRYIPNWAFSTLPSNGSIDTTTMLNSMVHQGDIPGILRSYARRNRSSSSSSPSVKHDSISKGNDEYNTLATVLPVAVKYLQALRHAIVIHHERYPVNNPRTFLSIASLSFPSPSKNTSTSEQRQFTQILQDITHTFSTDTNKSMTDTNQCIHELSLLASLIQELAPLSFNSFSSFTEPSPTSSFTSTVSKLTQQILIQASDKCIQLLSSSSLSLSSADDNALSLPPSLPTIEQLRSLIHSITIILRTYSSVQIPHLPLFDTIFTYVQTVMQHYPLVSKNNQHISSSVTPITDTSTSVFLQNLLEMGTLFLWWNTNNFIPTVPNNTIPSTVPNDTIDGSSVLSTLYEGNQANWNEQTYHRYTVGIIHYYSHLLTTLSTLAPGAISNPVLCYCAFYGSILLKELSEASDAVSGVDNKILSQLPSQLLSTVQNISAAKNTRSLPTTVSYASSSSSSVSIDDVYSSIQQSFFTFTPRNLVTGLTLLSQQFASLPEHPFATFLLPDQQSKLSSLILFRFFFFVAEEIKVRLQGYEQKYLDGYFHEWNHHHQQKSTKNREDNRTVVDLNGTDSSSPSSTDTNDNAKNTGSIWSTLSFRSTASSSASYPTLDAASYAYAQKLRTQYTIRSTTVNPVKFASLVTEIGFRVPDVSFSETNASHSSPGSSLLGKTSGWSSMSQRMSSVSVTNNNKSVSVATISNPTTVTTLPKTKHSVSFLSPLPMYRSSLFLSSTDMDGSSSSLSTYRLRLSSIGIRIHYRFHPSQLYRIAQLCIPSSYPPVANIPSLIHPYRSLLAMTSNDILHTIGLLSINYALTGETDAIDEVKLLALYSHYGILHRGYFAAIARRVVARGTVLPSQLQHLPVRVLVTYLYAFALGWEFDQDAFTVLFRELRQRSSGNDDSNGKQTKAFSYMVAPEYEWSRGIGTDDTSKKEQEIQAAASINLPFRVTTYYASVILPTLNMFSSFGKNYTTNLPVPLMQRLASEVTTVAQVSPLSAWLLPSQVYRDPSLFSLYAGPYTNGILDSSCGTWDGSLTSSSYPLNHQQQQQQQRINEIITIVAAILEIALTDVPSQLRLLTKIEPSFNKAIAVLSKTSSSPLHQPSVRTFVSSLFNLSGQRSHPLNRYAVEEGNPNNNNINDDEYIRALQDTLRQELSRQDTIDIQELLQTWYTLYIGPSNDDNSSTPFSSSSSSVLILPLCLPYHKIVFEPIIPSSAITLATPFRSSLRSIITNGSVGDGTLYDTENIAASSSSSSSFSRSMFFGSSSSSSSSPSSLNNPEGRERTARTIYQAGILPSLSTMYRSTVLNSLDYTYIGIDMVKIYTLLESTKDTINTNTNTKKTENSNLHYYSSIGYQQVAQYIASLLPSPWRM